MAAEKNNIYRTLIDPSLPQLGWDSIYRVPVETTQPKQPQWPTLDEFLNNIQTKQKLEEVKNNVKYQTSVKVFVETFCIQIKTQNNSSLDKDIISKIQLLFVDEKFKKLTLREIDDLSKLDYDNLIPSKYWFKNENKDALFYACKILSTWYWRELINKSYKSKSEDPLNLKINDLILNLSSDLWILGKLKEINFQIGLNGLNNFREELIKKVSLQKWEWEWELKEKAASLWLNDRILIFAHTNKDIKVGELQNNLKEISTDHLNSDDKDIFNKKIFPFYGKIKNLIVNNFSFDNWKNNNRKKFEKFFNNQKNDLTIKELLELYIITQWETDYDKLNDVENWILIIKIWWILWKDIKTRGETYDKIFKNSLYKDIDILPAWVKNILKQVIWDKIDEVIENTTEGFVEIFHSTEWPELIAITSIIIGSIYIAKKTVWIIRVASLTVTITAILLILAKYLNAETWEYVFPNGKTYKKEFVEKSVKNFFNLENIEKNKKILNNELKKDWFIDKKGNLNLNEIKKIYLQMNEKNKLNILYKFFHFKISQNWESFNWSIMLEWNTLYIKPITKKEKIKIKKLLDDKFCKEFKDLFDVNIFFPNNAYNII